VESTRYVQIQCRICCIRTLVIAGRPWPKRCIRCGEAFEPAPRALDPRADPGAAIADESEAAGQARLL
jgi:hypothetical protein